ncbi:MAG: pyridoxamine 5'-phosphate oxidase family protein [Coriobacteriales bacterium]|jgi:general stress protein 26|nr:pyridoxamine 5'-phosphate oxidase family protein [Coriobacteriales bacterium]
MDQEIIDRAAGIIQSKTGGIGGGMEGYAVLALFDEYDYPTASTLTISKAEGIKWMTFLTGLESNKAKRIGKCNRGSVCLASTEYNITLVGTLEVLTGPEVKREHWYDAMGAMVSGPEDPVFCVLRFTTERYNLFFADNGTEAKGSF